MKLIVLAQRFKEAHDDCLVLTKFLKYNNVMILEDIGKYFFFGSTCIYACRTLKEIFT